MCAVCSVSLVETVTQCPRYLYVVTVSVAQLHHRYFSIYGSIKCERSGEEFVGFLGEAKLQLHVGCRL